MSPPDPGSPSSAQDELSGAADSLAVATRRLRNLVAASPMGIHLYALKPGGELILVGANPASDRILGIETSALVGKAIEEAFPGLGETEIPVRYRAAATDGKPFRIPRFPYEQGDIKGVYEVNAFQTAPGEMAVYFLDITERDRAEQALLQSEEKFRSVVEQSNDALYILYQNRFDLVNQRFCELTGVTPEEAAAPEFDLWELVAPWSVPLIEERQARRERGEEVPAVYPFDIRTKAGEIVNVEASVTQIDYHEGKAVLGVLRDLTQQRKLEAQLTQSQKMESIGRLSGGIAHDLNNLLTPIIGFGELIMEDLPLDTRIQEAAREVVDAGFRARDLVRQLLAFSRQQTLEFRHLNLNEMIRDFRQLLRRTIREDIDIRISADPALPPIRGDRSQLEQVLMNLAINARDAMPEGGVLRIDTERVELDEDFCRTHPGATPGWFAKMAVIDTGVGMDDRVLERMFEPFFTTKDTGEGTGLGLATVYGIVKQHGGYIYVDSLPGEGAAFRCYFPAEVERKRPVVEEEEIHPETQGEESVLVVEDDPRVRKLAVQILQRHGYRVEEAKDGLEALQVIQDLKGPLDLLVTDVVMPAMNGRQLFDTISPKLPGLKVLFMSGYSKDVVSQEAILDDGIDFLQKPFTVQSLAQKVRSVLDR